MVPDLGGRDVFPRPAVGIEARTPRSQKRSVVIAVSQAEVALVVDRDATAARRTCRVVGLPRPCVSPGSYCDNSFRALYPVPSMSLAANGEARPRTRSPARRMRPPAATARVRHCAAEPTDSGRPRPPPARRAPPPATASARLPPGRGRESEAWSRQTGWFMRLMQLSFGRVRCRDGASGPPSPVPLDGVDTDRVLARPGRGCTESPVRPRFVLQVGNVTGQEDVVLCRGLGGRKPPLASFPAWL